jgi:hypothetical protein
MSATGLLVVDEDTAVLVPAEYDRLVREFEFTARVIPLNDFEHPPSLSSFHWAVARRHRIIPRRTSPEPKFEPVVLSARLAKSAMEPRRFLCLP